MHFFRLFKVFCGKVQNKVTTSLSLLTGINFTKPDGIYYLMSNRCNFRCPMCDQWKMGQTEDVKEYLTPVEVKKMIDQASAWGIKSFGISGGEPLLFKDRLLEYLTYANKKGMYTHFVTNGWLLDEEIIRAYDSVGGGHISLSLDAFSPLHDELRGTPGAFERGKKALEAYKKVKPKNILLKINLVISEKNLNEVLDVVKMARTIGVSIWLQPYDPYNWATRKSLNQTQYHEKYPLWISEHNFPKLEKVIKDLIKLKKSDASLIINSLEHLAAMTKYFAVKLNRKTCNVGYRSFVIGPFGEVSVCRFGEVGNIRQQTVKEIWRSKKYDDVRKVANHCNYDCLLGCMYDPSIFSWIRSGLSLFFKK